MEIKSTKGLQPDSLTVLIYGQSGSGKTTLASTLKDKTLIVNAESGLLTLRSHSIDYVTLEGKGHQKVQHLRSIFNEIAISDYNNIFIDSLTEIGQCFYDEALINFPNDSHTQKRYGQSKENIINFIKGCRDMKKNVFLTALEKTDKDETGRRFLYPSLVGSAAVECPQFMDFVFHLEVYIKEENKIRALLTDSKNNVIAKSRQPLNEYEPADLQAFIEKIRKGEEDV